MLDSVKISTTSQYLIQVTGFFQADNAPNSTSSVVSVYTNVKPHITDYYFEKSDASATTNQIQGSQAEAINLVLKVKDYNGCANIDSASMKADLSQLGLDAAEPLVYASCETDGKTAIFKKTGITTLSPLGDKTFSSSSFVVVDEDGNQADVNDALF